MAPRDSFKLSTSPSLEVAFESPSKSFNVIDADFELDEDDCVDIETLDYNNWLEIKAHKFNNYLISPIDSVLESFTVCSVNALDVVNLSALEMVDSVSSVGRSRNMLFSVSLCKSVEPEGGSFVDSHALVDSGAMANLISESLVLSLQIPVVEKKIPYKVVMANRSVAASIRFETLPIWLCFGSHLERLTFDVMPSLSHPLIVGLPWLASHNPMINWPSRSIDFPNCSCSNTLNVSSVSVDSNLVELDCNALIRFGEGFEDADIFDNIPVVDEDFSGLPAQYLEFKDVFSSTGADILPQHRKYDCEIVFKDPAAIPPFRPIFNLPEADRAELTSQINELLRKGFIRHSKSPAGAAVFFVAKKDGSKRLCVDYRWLNALCIRNSFPLPLISDLIVRLRHAKVFTKIDLRGAYNLVRVKPGDEWKTAFRCALGHFEFTVMPFGLTNAPAMFQSMMTDIFRDILDIYVVVYIDDLLIFSNDVDSHVEHVREVLRRLREHRLFAKLSKCSFHASEVEFLGFVISGSGISMAQDKVDAIKAWPVPKNVRGIQSFLGFVNFYRKFIRDFSVLSAPLTNLTKKDAPWDWSSDCQDAFDSLKAAVGSAPCLSHPRFDLPFILETDASNFAVGAVLSQPSSSSNSDDLRPVGFYSRKMSSAEINYDVHDKELLAIICALDHWSHFFLGAPHSLTIFTDHRNLVYFRQRQTLSPRLLRWSLFINQFNFVLTYRRGSSNIPADLLSRRSDFVEEGCESPPVEQVLLPDKFWSDSNFSVAVVLSDTSPRFVESEAERIQIILQRHNSVFSGHPGRAKTFALISRDFTWPGMREMIYKYVDSCAICQQTKTSRKKPLGLLTPLPVASRPWKCISMDFITKLPLSNNFDSILVVVDRFSKMTHFIPCSESINAENLAKLFIENIVRYHGLPDNIVSDRGPQFISTFWKTLLNLLHVSISLSSAAHPQTDGQTERMNQNLEQYLRCFVNYLQDDWSQILSYAEFAINNVPNSSTGKSPFEINYGFNPGMDYLSKVEKSEVESVDSWIDNLNLIHLGIEIALNEAARKMTFYANKHRRDHNFKVGDLVWLSTQNLNLKRPSKKLDFRRVGPFKILEFINQVAVRLELPEHVRIHPVFHVSLLAPYKSPQVGQEQHCPAPIEIDGELEYYAELVLNVRKRKNTTQYLMKWYGYDDTYNSWSDLKDVVNSWQLILEFYSHNPTALRPSRKELSDLSLSLEGV